jgi:conjugal transfer pilus assembly protein TraF
VAALAWGDDRAAIDAPRFYDQSKHGWFWYEDPPAEPEAEQPPDQPVPSVQSVNRDVSLANYSTEELWTLYPDDFQQLLNGLQKKAVQYPTEQNILEYLSIQDIARRKALAYANATQYVTQKRADLFTLNQVYPVSTPGVAARVRLQQDVTAGRCDRWTSPPSRTWPCASR